MDLTFVFKWRCAVCAGEYTVPAGAFLTFSPLLLHRDERLWPQPARFRPERFGPEEAQRRHPFAYIPFSAGPRGCIGQRFALLEEKAVLSAVLRHFRLEAVQREEDVRPLMELILRPEQSVRVRFVERAPAHLHTRN
ncbi:Probable cytochrome P450 6t3 [Gryllus bimaculatus]|nr:Probable cytochrome P450 6t3 [Gryllus bimaculatus]